MLFAWTTTVTNLSSFILEYVDVLQSHTSYVAGCRDSAVGTRTDLYDVLVNLPAREITVAPHAKGNNNLLHSEIIYICWLCMCVGEKICLFQTADYNLVVDLKTSSIQWKLDVTMIFIIQWNLPLVEYQGTVNYFYYRKDSG